MNDIDAEKIVKQEQCSQKVYVNPSDPSKGYKYVPNGFLFVPTETLKEQMEAEQVEAKGRGAQPKTMTYKLRLHNLEVARINGTSKSPVIRKKQAMSEFASTHYKR